ncbi:electron transfer flavoprotein subunit alpha [Marinomonas sp. TW1]|uniref:electron transfer flavoprotein subunit alpha n=1 Tax=Marinomonas sp. TW1 TaxID=1561203 RepID=UPI0007AF2322|nr:electron transfer flavoprotein subunit alpha/FixB family protein [Marinomonas sp. TW1]KZN14906.1 electron transfer flavoprotein subunit alpha [Marinomonas sp. TW1]
MTEHEDILRRDPRAEWIARNRLHPLHQAMTQVSVVVRGPSGLVRKSPHQVGFIGPNGIKRIDRLAGNGQMTAGATRRRSTAQEVVLPLHQVMEPNAYIMVVPDMAGGRLTAQDKDILGLAHELAKQRQAFDADERLAVVAVCFGESKEAQFDEAGVDRLVHLSAAEYEGFAPEQRLQALLQLDVSYQPTHWLFPDSVHGGTDLACRLAVKLGERPAAQAWQVSIDTTICRAASGSQDIQRDTPRILMLLEECGQAIDETRHEVLPLPFELASSEAVYLEDKGLIAVDPNAVPLAEAEFILSAGNGIHNWQQFHDCATLLGATEGASRVAVDDGFMPRMRQVGASGTWVTAQVYMAVGISGAIQHMQGIGQCDKIVAINTDAGCDMVKRADLAVIADSEAILAELCRLAQQHTGKTLEQNEVTSEVSHVA